MRRPIKLLFILAILPIIFVVISACQHGPARSDVHHSLANRIEVIEFRDLPGLTGSEFKLGAFSGLTFEGNRSGLLTFRTHTDRGPNGEPQADPKSGLKTLRPFLQPDFQPRWVQFSFDPSSKSLRIDGQTPLTHKGRPLTGLPNKVSGDRWDETPVSGSSKRLGVDLMGLDLEGIARDDDGTYWMSEEYRPSILHFDANGKLLSRWVPEGSPKGSGEPKLPSIYLSRQMNRGFEGIAYRNGTVFAFLQSSLKGEDGVARILAVETKTGKVEGEYRYEFQKETRGGTIADKIGDATALPDGSFLVLEQNSERGETGIHSIYRIVLRAGGVVEKSLVADLVELGLSNYEKMEGLTVVDSKTLALVTDNDFNATGRGENPAFILLHLAEPLY